MLVSMRTTCPRWDADNCWPIWTIDSTATPGFELIRLRGEERRGREGREGREGGRERREGRNWVGMRVRERDDLERGKGRRHKKWKEWEETSTMSLLEDLSQHPVSLDAVYVLSDDGFLFVSSLFLQPLHHRLVVVPQVRLQGGRGQSGTISQTSMLIVILYMLV